MRIRALAFYLSLLLLIGGPMAMSAWRQSVAQRQLASALVALNSTIEDGRAIFDLRAQQQRIGNRDRPAQDVIAQLNSVMMDVGIPSNHLKSLTPESDALVTQGDPGNDRGEHGQSGQFKKQSLRVILENLTIDELGALLIQWRQRQQIWTPTRIELTHVRSQTAVNNRYDATILISATYLADG